MIINDEVATQTNETVATCNFAMSAGKTLKIEAEGLNEKDVLVGVVPSGKTWTVEIRVEITESSIP